jgi:hypothetical protein
MNKIIGRGLLFYTLTHAWFVYASTMTVTAPASVLPGATFNYTYTIKASTNGAYIMQDSIPGQFQATGVQAPDGGMYARVGNEVAWEIHLQANKTATFIVNVKVPPTGFTCGTTTVVNSPRFYPPEGYVAVTPCKVGVLVTMQKLGPVGITSGLGKPLTLKGQAGNYSYQWSKDGQPISGATNPSLSLAGVSTDTGLYGLSVRAVGTNCASSSTLQVMIGQTEEAGNDLLNYQWYKDGQVILNGNKKNLPLQGASSDSGMYNVIITDSNGCKQSAKISVSISSCEPTTMY